jgi:hypothetical protein
VKSLQVLWRRLDAPGLDACRVRIDWRGVRLDGHAMFVENGERFRLRYSVATDARLRARRAVVAGHAGTTALAIEIRRSDAGEWTLNAHVQPEVRGCIDVDLAFTPATNLLPLRRLQLARGQRADAPAAYLSLQASQLRLLPQSYQRIGRLAYRYEAPTFGYADTLHVSPLGVVLRYPGLFEAVFAGDSSPSQ